MNNLRSDLVIENINDFQLDLSLYDSEDNLDLLNSNNL